MSDHPVTHMAREIDEIPAVAAAVLGDGMDRIDAAAAQIARRDPRFVLIAARGTSDHAGVFLRYLFETALGIPVGLAAASVTTIYGAQLRWDGVLLVGVSQSGAGPDVAAVVAAARDAGAPTLAITNEPGSVLASAAELVLPLQAGEERAVAATKTYVASLAVAAALIARIADHRGEPVAWAPALADVPDALAATLRDSRAWLAGPGASCVTALTATDEALVVSRGHNYATALELALKLKETGRIFAEGFSTADLLHGPVAVAGPDLPTLAIRPDGPAGTAVDEALAIAARRGIRPWTIGGTEVAARERALVVAPDLPEPLTPLAYVLPGFLVAEAAARARGRDPDAPPGLSKVTRTR
ncbi:MAG: SIS domain-containing protein [Chloroflexi bacterium]|jgi:glucosamine--fructose-6-phosphate aminotransferase (isomerizing)|nr:SIS domain-containing protein [Chloroflexota bacterium]